jgi:hypothetical protein
MSVDAQTSGGSPPSAPASLTEVILQFSPDFVLKHCSPTAYVVLVTLAASWLWLRMLYFVTRRFTAPSIDPDAWLECLAHSPHRNLILPPHCVSSAAKSGIKNRAVSLAQGVKQVVARRFKRNDVLNGNSLIPGALPASCTPLVCFVNHKSGGNQGIETLSSLRPLLNPLQIFDVHSCDSAAVLRAFSVLPRLRVLVAGGDGTVAAIIKSCSTLDADKRPPIAILPLGTGNDLARTLGWGGTADIDNLAAYLSDVCNAVPQVLATTTACRYTQRRFRVVLTSQLPTDARSLEVHCIAGLRPQLLRLEQGHHQGEGVHELLRNRNRRHDCNEI